MTRLLIYRWSDVPWLAALALGYALLAKIVLDFFSANGVISVIWPSSGLALAALLLGGRKYWPGIFAGALAGALMAGCTAWVAAFIAAGNTLEAFVCLQVLFRSGHFDTALTHPRDFLWLTLAAAAGACVSALTGTTTLLLTGFLTRQTLAPGLLHWWQGDMLGIILATPLILIWRRAPPYWLGRQRALEAAGCFGLTFIAGQIIFLGWFHDIVGDSLKAFLIFPFITWSAARFGRHGVLLVIGITALQGLLGSIHKVGYFASEFPQIHLSNFWLYLIVLTLVGMTQALTIFKRRQSEAALRTSEERWKFALEGAGDGVWDWDFRTGEIFFSERCHEILGYTEEERQGGYRHWQSTIHPEDYARMMQDLHAHLDGKTRYFNNEHRARYRDGSWKWLLTRGMVVSRDASGKALRLIGTQTDITERKRQEMANRSHSQVLEQVSKGLPLPDILATLALSVEVQNPAMRCSLLLLDGDGKHLLTGAAPSLPHYYNSAIHGTPVGIGAGSFGTAACTGRRVIVEDIASHPYWQSYKALAASAGLGACWSEPIMTAAGKMLGTFSIYHSTTKAPDAAEIDLLEQSAKLAGIAIERQLASDALRESSQYLRTIIETSPECVKLIDKDGTLLAINAAGLKMIEADNEAGVVGQNVYPVIAPEYRDAFRELNERVCQGQKDTLEYEIIGLHGTRRWMETHAVPFSSKPGEKLVQLSITRDITKRKEAEVLIWQQANFDPLTGLPNRRMLYDRLEQACKKSRRTGLPLAVIFLDLDRFKEVNDALGHDMGDILLIDAAQRLRGCVRETDTVARLGGDEFTIILTEVDDISIVERIARTILQKLIEPFHMKNEVAYVSASIGITFYPDDGEGIDTLLKNADQAMYASKNQGRNRYNYFTPSMQEAAHNRMRLANDLRGALEAGQFSMAYQPIVEMATGVIHKAEALIRWQHPIRGPISPAEFITIAEETGLVIDIGDWVFREAACQVKHWRKLYRPDFQISVNKSPIQFHNENSNHAAWFEHLQQQELSGQSIVVEITEGVLLDASTAVTDQLLEFCDASIQVAIDDFGTGYSSLSYLKKFDIDYLKIDQSFVSNLAYGSDDMALCEAIIVMAHKLGIKVIAEGVETPQQRDLLTTVGCDYGQGYLFSKPLPAEAFERLLSSQNATQPGNLQ
ncbi:EAL domain-containing protein [Methylobacter marinus]|uniref:EAL domain-containing protein n=1 Tax=Methylobacter marinus TaxID=34058 RepID=UPI00036FBED7|nr:EAL domain-containing protein [Methylobacter marinus]